MRVVDCLLIGALLLAGHAFASGKAHEHGVAKLNLTVQGDQLILNVEMPMDNLVGFERAPQNDAERTSLAAAVDRLRAAVEVVKPALEAQCVLSAAKVDAPFLDAKPDASNGHADVDAEYVFMCKQPAKLSKVDLGFFESFRRLKRIEVQLATAKGQHKVTLRAPARSLVLSP